MHGNITYLDKVKEALAYYGGEASLNDIYTYIKGNFGYRLPNSAEQASIRKAIYFHSSDADLFKGEKDLFYTVEVKGNGLWGLRSRIPTTEYTDKTSDNVFPISEDIGLTEDDDGFPEGKQKLRTHLQRERNPKLIIAAKKKFKAKYGRLFCEVCNFDFQK